MKKSLLFFLLLLTTATLWAQYDFSALAPSGQTLYYKINSDGTSVTLVPEKGSSPYYTTKPTGDLTIPSTVTNGSKTYTVTSIGNDAFYYCSGLTGSITIPNTVTSIGNHAFYNCSKLTGIVTIPNSVKSIGVNPFAGCSKLTEINVVADNPNYISIDGILYNKSKNRLIGCPAGKIGSITIPNSVTSIGNYAFYDCSSLTGSLTIPNSVTSIGEWAFCRCTRLTGTLSIPNSVTSIGRCAFLNCTRLTGTLTIPNSVTSIGDNAFYGCTGLTGTLTIPNSVTSIEHDAFYGCTGLTSVTIPNSVTSIGEGAFGNCSGLTGTLIIPNSVTSIGHKAFYGCKGLTGIVTIPNSVTSIGVNPFAGCSKLTEINVVADNPNYISIDGILYNKSKNRLIGCPAGKTGSVTIPNSVTNIGDNAFDGCKELTGTLTIPNSVISIGEDAFARCKGLTCITIPNSVTSIKRYAFYDCSRLAAVYCEALTPPDGSGSTNQFSNYNIPLYVPASSIEAYRSHAVWGKFTTILPISNTPYTVSVSVNNASMGTATGGKDCNRCETITLTATPNTGYHFVQWSDGNTDNARTVIVTKDTSFTAIFAADGTTYAVNTDVNDPSMGSVSGGGEYSEGETVTLIATPKEGYHFVKWSDENTDNPRTITVTGETNLTAIFAINTYTVTATTDDASKGSVTGGGTYNHGETATLTATPEEGYHFVQWSDGNTDNARTVTATQDSVFTAIFAANSTTYTVTADVNDPSMGSVSGGGEYSEGETVTLIATPKEGYHFVKWSDENTDNPRTITVTGETNLTAIFAINTYTVTATTDDASKGSVTGGGTYNHGETATLTATPEEGYHFVQWSDGNTDNARTVTATQDSVFTAIFAINTYTVTATTDDASKGSVTGGGTYNHGETATLTATPNAGYCFFGWSDGSTENPRAVTATQDSTITAIFDFKRRNHTATVCQGEAYAYQDSVFNTTTAGTYSKEVRFSNAYDCDSVVTVNLTVTAKSSATGIMLKDTCFEMGKATQLKVESPVATATYRFYDSHHTLLHTGTEYTTTPLSSEEVFYVTMQEPSKCESAEKNITISECVTPTHLFQLHKTVDNASVCKNSIVTITTVIEKLTPALIHKIQIIEDFGFADLKLLTAELKIDGKTVPYTRDVAHNKLFFNMGELSGIGTYTLTITARAFPNLGPKTETTTIRWANYPTGITETATFNVVD